jgi:hypothetical protein
MMEFYLQLFDLSGAFNDLVEKLLSEKVSMTLHCQATVGGANLALRSALRRANSHPASRQGAEFL